MLKIMFILLPLFNMQLINAAENATQLEGIHMHAIGTFNVSLTPQTDDTIPVGRMLIEKTYVGDMIGVGQGQMISKRTENGTAAYSAIEEFAGELQGKKGSFTLLHQGFMSADKQELNITILNGSGTDELSGITGQLVIIQQAEQHHYELNYSLHNNVD